MNLKELGEYLELFLVHPTAKGSLIWLDKGLKLIENLLKLNENISKSDRRNRNFSVKTPSICSQQLWEKSGHLKHFSENMFLFSKYGLKPMNCPLHYEIFKKIFKSLKELPITINENQSVFRKESSGAINPPLRNNEFIQDDSHTFLLFKDLTVVIQRFFINTLRFYLSLGFKKIKTKISLSENIEVKKANDFILKNFTNWVHDINAVDGAFYGPKFEFTIKDNLSREWQCGTIQLDFIASQKFDLKLQNQEVIVIHKAVMGSLERFIGILLEYHNGKIPNKVHPDPYKILIFDSKKIKYFKNFPFENLIVGIENIRKIVKKKYLYNELIFFGEREYNHNEIRIQNYEKNQENLKILNLNSFLKSFNK